MKKNNTPLYLGLGVLVVLATMFSTGLFSVLGENPGCDIPEFGGECTVDLVLPQDREFSAYDLVLDVQKAPSSEFGSFKPITHSSKSPRLFEEDSERDEFEWETVFMYNIPEQDVFAIQVQAETSGTATSSTSADNARAKIELNGISTRYVPDNVVVCPERRSDDCIARFGGESNEFYTIRDYRNSDGDDDYTISNDLSASGNFYEAGRSDDFVNGLHSGGFNLMVDGVIEGDAVRKDAFFIITGNDYEDSARSTVIETPTNVQYAVKQFMPTLNFGYGLPGQQPLETQFGEFNGELQTLDISEQLNNACGRNSNDAGVCTVQLTFSASSGARVDIIEENEVLAIYEGRNTDPIIVDGEEPVNQGGNLITGFSVRELVDEPQEQTIALIILGVLVIVGIIFIPFGGKKK